MIDPLSISYAYVKLRDLIKSIDSIPANEWTPIHSLAYICNRYSVKFDTPFILSYKGAPSQSYEYKLVCRIWMILQAKSGDGLLVKNYIDWFYDNYKGKRKFTSIGALTKIELVASFKEDQTNKKQLKMTTLLPDQYLNLLNKYEQTSYIKTYGDLYFFHASMKDEKEFVPIKTSLETAGFNFNILSEL